MKEKGPLITYATLVCLLSLPLAIQFAAATTGWDKTYGGRHYDIARSIVQTNDGGYALAGFTESYGAGESDFWLVKVDSSGNEMWNRTYGGTEDDDAYCVIQTSDGGYALSGYTKSYGSDEWSYWLVKVDSLGNMQWNKTYAGLEHGSFWNAQTSSVVQTDDGGYALAGFFPRSKYESDFCLVKVDSSGDMQWNRTYEGPVYTMVFLIRTSDGGYAMAGTCGIAGIGFWLVKVDSSGNVQWNNKYEGGSLYSAVQTSDDGYILAGNYIGAQDDVRLVKVDSSGNKMWNRTYGGSEDDSALCVVQTSDGGYALAGYTKSYGAGETDSWLVKVDSSGDMQWNKTYGGTWSDSLNSVIQTLDGGYALAGETHSYSSFFPGVPDFWLIKTDETGIIPEFPSLFAILLFLTLTILTVLVRKRKWRTLDSARGIYCFEI